MLENVPVLDALKSIAHESGQPEWSASIRATDGSTFEIKANIKLCPMK